MPNITLVQDRVDTEMCRVYGKHPKYGPIYLISIIHIDMVTVLFGENIAKYWFEDNPTETQIEITLGADPVEEE